MLTAPHTNRLATAAVGAVLAGALAVALGIGVTSASARPSDLNSNSSSVPAPTTTAAALNPETRSVAAAGAGHGYGDSPIASSGEHGPRSEVVSGGGYGDPNTTAATVHESSSSDAFDLPSAAIGAAAGTGLVIVLLAVGGLAHRRSLTRRRAAGA
jgi:hypothetical protein